jgi:hypothetical protein
MFVLFMARYVILCGMFYLLSCLADVESSVFNEISDFVRSWMMMDGDAAIIFFLIHRTKISLEQEKNSRRRAPIQREGLELA